ncbi:MAG: hypothetical protein LBU26_00975 [Synergistaceae bacterium]|nr:hypothetical protein [Synergistaceae bacterium]
MSVVKFLGYSVRELEAQKLALLLPFYVLKLRKKAARARTSKRRAELAGEMKAIMDELVGAADRSERAGLMGGADKQVVLDHMDRLYRELFAQYDEFVEVDTVLKDRILTYSEEAKLRGIAEGKFEVARNFLAMGLTLEQVAEGTGLPQNELQALLPH